MISHSVILRTNLGLGDGNMFAWVCLKAAVTFIYDIVVGVGDWN